MVVTHLRTSHIMNIYTILKSSEIIDRGTSKIKLFFFFFLVLKVLTVSLAVCCSCTEQQTVGARLIKTSQRRKILQDLWHRCLRFKTNANARLEWEAAEASPTFAFVTIALCAFWKCFHKVTSKSGRQKVIPLRTNTAAARGAACSLQGPFTSE